ncbi:MAG TPA: VOC family protein [Acidimicrobiia bacterium]|nr:VOC family protein [Acidimicrobiia bacterium]
MAYLVGLMEHGDGVDAPFDHRRLGLDHFALHVPERSDLDEWVEHLDALGITHSGVQETPYSDTICFRDPDGIPLELACPKLDFWVALLSREA